MNREPQPGCHDEALLIEQVRKGRTELFDRLVIPYRRNVWLLCRSILGNSADAEDAVQDAFLKAFQRLEQLRDDQNFPAWLLRIGLNEARERRRRDSRWKLDSLDETAGDQDAEFMPSQFGDWRYVPSVEVEREQTRRLLESCLDSLPVRYREILVLRDIEQLAMADVAAILGISLAAATSRLHRARLEMREKVAPFFAKPTPRWVPLRRMMFDMTRLMLSRSISCKRAIREVSNYIDGDLDPALRAEIERHLQLCRRCAIVFDSTKQVVFWIVGDGLVYPVALPARVLPHDVVSLEFR